MKPKALKVLLAEHAENVKRGCTCPPPSKKDGMTFKPRAEKCPLHGELAVS